MANELNQSFEVLKLMKRVSQKMKQQIHANMGELNLTAPQGMMIGILSHHGAQKVSDLSERMYLSNSTVSGIIDRLEKCGCVERIRSQEDRRVVMIDLVPEFKKTIGSKFKEVDEIMAKTISQATPEEMAEIIRGLSTLDRVMTASEGVEQKV
jgi:DNA-binding MarR family transcriptional regulator